MLENRPELALLRAKRTPEALERWVKAFAGGDKDVAQSYAIIVSRFTGRDEGGYASYIGRYSPNTRAAYAYALTEFFEWLGAKHGRVIPPHDVSRKDAEDYVEWLATKPFSLEAEKLRDGDQQERLAIYEVVKELGSSDLTSIAAKLPRAVVSRHSAGGAIDFEWLHRELGLMTLHDLLVRSPTIEELRKSNPLIGIHVFTVDLNGRQVPLESVFSYSTPKPVAVSRSTIALRLTALSSFWNALLRTEGKTLVKANVFEEVLERVSRGLSADRRAGRTRRRRLTPDMVDRLLRAAEGPSLVEKRDAALLWFLVLMGARVTETIRIVRDKPSTSELQRTPGWFDGRALPPSVELIRKGGFHQRLPYPPYALRALHAFQAELEKHAPPLGSQSDNPNAALYVRPDSSAWRYKLLATKPDAPLFPPVSFWGLNSPGNYRELRPNGLDYRKPMNRSAVTAILRRIADKAGFSDEEKLAVHGHAFRHFAATAMSRQGKPIRETQQILGHASIVTTETYVEDITSPEALSAQNEILDYIAGGERPRGAPAPEPRRPIVETHGIAVPPTAPEPETSEVGLPAEAPKVKALPEIQKTAKGLVAIAPKAVPPEVLEVEHGISSGSPYYAYEGADQLHFTMVEPRSGAKRETLYTKGSKEYVQREPWLREHYDPWPLSYGIGENSLLPWFARGAASSSGEVKVEVRTKDGKKVVTVPPLPVFAGEQLYSEAKAPTLWKRVLELRERWLRTAPTKAFGLDRWWGAFQEIQRGLARGTGGAFPVVPFDALGTVGTNIRAHDEEYLAAWLEKNADRYTTTVRAFEGIERPRGGSLTDEEWLSFQEKFAAASLIGVSPAEELPDWFMLDDPVRAIYDHSSEEWEWFEKWIGAVTGQRLTPARDAERARDAAFASTAIETRIEEARELLAAYFESVEELKNQPKGEDADREREVIRLLRDRLLALGVPDPGATKGLARDLKARIEELIALGFPSADVELVDPNVLRSALFDKDTFRIDTSKKTISHTPEFRKDFAERYDGRDSECVARRAARGMWEHVKRHGIPVKRGAERSSEYSLLYSVMLSYLSWIVPCPEAIEERMGKERSARMRYLTGFRRASARVLRTGDVDEPGLRRIAVEEGLDDAGAGEVLEAALVQDSMRAEVALPPPPVAEAMARSAIESGNVHVAAVPAIVVTRGRRRTVEAPRAPVTYYSVGGDEETDLTPNAPPRRYLTPNAFEHGLGRMALADLAMPGALRLMAAMTRPF